MLPLHPQTEQIWFGNGEVEILIVQLSNHLRGARSRCLRCEILEKDSREGREKVDVGGLIESLFQVGCDVLEVFGVRFDKIDYWHVRDRMPGGSNMPIGTNVSVVVVRM